MSQVSGKLRRGNGRYFHWCPGCEEMHPLPDSWTFNGDLEKPTFSPSFLQTFVRWSGGVAENGLGIGEKAHVVCHYVLTDGVLNYCGDSWHDLKGTPVTLPDLPPHAQDELDRIMS